MNIAGPRERITVGVVVERRPATNPWGDSVWTVAGVLAGTPAARAWTSLGADGDTLRFYAGAADIELHRSATGHYRDNLVSGAPRLWVALRPTGAEPPFEIAGLTADPTEGEAFTEAGNDLVEGVPMPAAIGAVVAQFVAAHHVERPFYKRQRDRAGQDPPSARRPPEDGT